MGDIKCWTLALSFILLRRSFLFHLRALRICFLTNLSLYPRSLNHTHFNVYRKTNSPNKFYLSVMPDCNAICILPICKYMQYTLYPVYSVHIVYTMCLYVIIMSRTSFRLNLHSTVCLNVKQLIARSRRHIWSISNSDGIRT